MNTKSGTIRRIGKKAKSKRGATLVELIATVAILAIVSSLSFQAIFIASEEYQRATKISECQRSVSLMQRNLDKYIKTAVKVKFESSSSATNITDAINEFVTTSNTSLDADDKLQDADNSASDKYCDYILFAYVADPTNAPTALSFRLSKYTKCAGSNSFKPIFTVDNIKEMNFKLKLMASSPNSVFFDYTMNSMTNFEIINKSIDNNLADKSDYSVAAGSVMNNITDTSITTSSLNISTDFSESYKTNFVYFRTTQRR